MCLFVFLMMRRPPGATQSRASAASDVYKRQILGRPVVLTYHCDLHLPKGFIHGIANQVSHLANHVSAGMANVIITNTRDYAENSPFLTKYLDKVGIINPPAELPDISKEDLERFQQDWNIDPSQPVIGMAARLASEKGVEYLVEAMPKILEKHKGARVLFVGQYENLLGEEKYAQRLTPLIDKLKGHWTFLGNVNNKDLTAFYKSCDLTVLPSTNPTESFGMVQIESMICGVPVVASNMPGIRHPVQSTGMGLIVPAKNSTALANAILEILDHPHKYQGDSDFIRKLYSPDSVAEQYEQYFVKIIKNRKTKSKNINHGNSHG